jgi:YD repeat-containing protein
MKNILLGITLLIPAVLPAQYYYNDIIGTQEITAKMKTFIAARVQSVTAAGYDPRGVKTTDFTEWQEVQANGTVLKITSRNGQNVSRTYYTFDNKTRLLSARDSSANIQSITTYTYDANGNLTAMKTSSQDPFTDSAQTKEKQWKYTAEGKPATMLLINNGIDSIEYRFTLDDRKNVADEMMYHRGGTQNQIYYYYEQQKVYYFYDDQNRLTDITKYNVKLDQLLPDFMFEYDENNRVIQKIAVLSKTKIPDYFTWRYGYDEKGLKTKDVLWGKNKDLKGRIEYTYTFVQ